MTTARDMALLGRALRDRFPRYFPYFSTASFAYGKQRIPNHNHLLGRVAGVNGIKTGYTVASGYNLVTSVDRDGRQVIAVVLGGKTGKARDQRMIALINDVRAQGLDRFAHGRAGRNQRSCRRCPSRWRRWWLRPWRPRRARCRPRARRPIRRPSPW